VLSAVAAVNLAKSSEESVKVAFTAARFIAINTRFTAIIAIIVSNSTDSAIEFTKTTATFAVFVHITAITIAIILNSTVAAEIATGNLDFIQMQDQD